VKEEEEETEIWNRLELMSGRVTLFKFRKETCKQYKQILTICKMNAAE
jgi:tellurite resistance-related uncharacterized protein